MRTRWRASWLRANSQATSAVRRLPTCSVPVGEGAKRPSAVTTRLCRVASFGRWPTTTPPLPSRPRGRARRAAAPGASSRAWADRPRRSRARGVRAAARSYPATTPRPRAASGPLSPRTTPPSESALDEGPNWPCRRLRLARAGRWARGMPPFARLLALSITVALAALGAAPAAQAAVLPLAHASVAVVDSPHDGVVAGGDTLLITETVHNTGAVTLTGLTATLATQTAGVSIDQGSSAYLDVAASADAANTTPLQVTLDPSLPCGTTLHFTLTVSNGTGSAVVPFTVATGAQGDFADYTGSPAVIGETLPSLRKVLSSVSYAGVAQVSDPGIVQEVRVDIGSLTHPNISHLSLSLKAPDGTTVPLVDAGHGTAGQSFTGTDLVGDLAATPLPATGPYTGTFKADGDLSAKAGLSQQGDWRLFVSEPNDTEIGRVNSWTLRIAAASCAPRSVAKLTATPNPVDPGADVVLDASTSGSAAPGGITRYEWDLADGTGFHEGLTPTTPTHTVRFAQRGTRTVTVRVSDATGVIGTASIHLIVSLLPNAVIGLPSGVKEQTYATLDGSGSNDPDGGAISSYEWE